VAGVGTLTELLDDCTALQRMWRNQVADGSTATT
jgi:hypothetical protein